LRRGSRRPPLGEKRGTTRSVTRLSLARAFARQSRAFGQVALTTYEGVWPTPIRDLDQVSRINQRRFRQLSVPARVPYLVDPRLSDVFGAHPSRCWSRASGSADLATCRRYRQRIVAYHDGFLHDRGVMPPGLDYPRGADV
jgi:hypothetical protein